MFVWVLWLFTSTDFTNSVILMNIFALIYSKSHFKNSILQSKFTINLTIWPCVSQCFIIFILPNIDKKWVNLIIILIVKSLDLSPYICSCEIERFHCCGVILLRCHHRFDLVRIYIFNNYSSNFIIFFFC